MSKNLQRDEISKKQVRYKIITSLLKIKEAVADYKDLFRHLDIGNIYISGEPTEVGYDDFKEQIEKLIAKGYLKEEGGLIRITSLGEEYAKSPKGESSWYNY